MGGYAAAYDLVSSEYGWDDDTIGELPLARLRQVTAAIQMRRYSSSRAENARFSWLARNISGFIAAGYQIEKGKENKALEQAGKLAYDDIEALLLGAETSNAVPVLSEDGTREVADPLRVADRNGTASFERFGMMSGQLAQRGRML